MSHLTTFSLTCSKPPGGLSCKGVFKKFKSDYQHKLDKTGEVIIFILVLGLLVAVACDPVQPFVKWNSNPDVSFGELLVLWFQHSDNGAQYGVLCGALAPRPDPLTFKSLSPHVLATGDPGRSCFLWTFPRFHFPQSHQLQEQPSSWMARPPEASPHGYFWQPLCSVTSYTRQSLLILKVVLIHQGRSSPPC